MALGTVRIGKLEVSRMIIGGNPFSGFSHQGGPRDKEMKKHYTVARIKDALRMAEALGVNTHLSRADHHVMRYLMEYWDEGGKLQWFAQTCPEIGTIDRGVENALGGGAAACYVHGGVMDYLFAQKQFDEVFKAIEKIHSAGLAAGVAGHNPKAIEWADKNLDCDFLMCSYYNSAHRDERAEHVSGMAEWFLSEDRDAMSAVIAGLHRPAIHYKVLAAGRNDPKEAMAVVARNLRPNDAVCVGICTKDHPDGLAEDIRLLDDALRVCMKT